MLDREIKSLITILEESNIDEIEISTFWGKQRIRLSKNSQQIKHSSQDIDNATNITTSTSSPEKTTTSKDENLPADLSAKIDKNESEGKSIKAPLVGTLYLSSKPDEPQYVNEGDFVDKGDTICIIEAMKIFNEIEAELSGRIIKILVNNGSPVEFDQDLFIIKPE